VLNLVIISQFVICAFHKYNHGVCLCDTFSFDFFLLHWVYRVLCVCSLTWHSEAIYGVISFIFTERCCCQKILATLLIKLGKLLILRKISRNQLIFAMPSPELLINCTSRFAKRRIWADCLYICCLYSQEIILKTFSQYHTHTSTSVTWLKMNKFHLIEKLTEITFYNMLVVS